jgi:DNA-binding NarL/FixJ family response regulator
VERFEFTKSEYEYFLSECPFTEEEEKIFNLRRKGKSIVEMSFALQMSQSTVSRRLKSVCRKVQKAILTKK